MRNVEPKITDLKHSHVQHGLDRLARFGIKSGIWNRLRFDDEFARAVGTTLQQMNAAAPGERLIGKIERPRTRLELSKMLLQANIDSLKDAVLLSLNPGDPHMGQQQLLDNPYEVEWFIVEPGYSMDEDVARMELDRRGLAPCTTEEGLSFMLIHTRQTSGQGIFVLDAWRNDGNDTKREFLYLGYTGSGRPCIWVNELHHQASRFLAKRKASPPPTVDAED